MTNIYGNDGINNKYLDSNVIIHNDMILKNSLGGIILYENSSGTNVSITLSDSISNYKRIDVISGKSDMITTNTFYVNYIGTGEHPIFRVWHDQNNAMGIFSLWYKFSGNKMTFARSLRYFYYTHETKPTIDTTKDLYIYAVIGYKI